MIERLIDKKIRVFEAVFNNPDTWSVSMSSLNMNRDELRDAMLWLHENRYINIKFIDPDGIFEEETNARETVINYSVISKEHIASLLAKLRQENPPKKSTSTFKIKALELIARKLGDRFSGNTLIDHLREHSIDEELIVYPNTKWRMLNDIFVYLAQSGKKEDTDLLISLLEGSCHPLMYDGDKKSALEMQDFMSSCLEYDDYCFLNGKLVRSTEEIKKEIEERKQDRQRKATEDFFNPSIIGAKLGNLFDDSIRSIKEQSNQTPPPPPVSAPNPIQVIVTTNNQIMMPQHGQTVEPSKKFPHKLPSGTMWENVIIKFIDDETVYIDVKKLSHTTTFADMGFAGPGKNPKPDVQWVFLKVLALQNGELSIKDKAANEKYRKQKELLTKGLREYFSIDYDPFHPYQVNNSYKIKLTLIPPQNSGVGDTKKASSDNDDLGIGDYYNQITPSMADDL